MDTTDFDICIFGSSPLAGLLAAILAARHGQRVVLAGVPWSAHRLPEGPGVSILPLTRPQSWRLLRALEAETIGTLDGFGAPGSILRADIEFVADTPSRAAALDHARHLALANGLKAWRVATLPPAMRFANAALLAEARFQPALEAALQRFDVETLPAEETIVARQRNGSVSLRNGARQLQARRTILADDAAILSHLTVEERPAILRPVDFQVTLTADSKPLRAALIDYPDRGVTLMQRGSRILARVRGFADVDARLASVLGDRLPLGRTATRRFQALETSDGAPLIGQLRAPRVGIIAGLGDAAPFFAPALARLAMGASTPDERAWFAAHDAAKPDLRGAVAEILPGAFA